MLGNAIIEIDLHGKTVLKARLTIDAALRRANKGVYRIRLIHGYHGGTELREMIRSEYSHRSGVIRVASVDEGVSDLVLREL